MNLEIGDDVDVNDNDIMTISVDVFRLSVSSSD